MAKQIPEIDIIATPTAGQESLIETVVARHDTYETSRMTLAQIFTLGSISGSIKVALDALSSLIATNTSDITNLGTNKLDKNAATRTGLTANRAIIIDASGNETYLTGTTSQQIGFDGAGKPIAITPTTDINGLTAKTTPVAGDKLIISDSEASFANKSITLSQILAPIGGNGSDGALTISSGTTTLAFDSNGYLEKNYSSITITGGTLTFSGAPANGGVAVIKCSGRFVMSGGTISISGFGGAGGGGFTGSPGPAGAGNGGFNVMKVVTTAGGGGGTQSGGGGAGSTGISHFGGYLQGYCGGGGGGAGGQVNGVSGGSGGGVLFIEVKESFSFTSGTITTAGANGVTATGNGGGSGGGGGGAIFVKCPNIVSNTGTINVNGGNGGNATVTSYNLYSGGGGGSSYSNGGAGGAGGANGVSGTSNSYGSGGTGGAGAAGATPTGGGGGGGAGFYKIN